MIWVIVSVGTTWVGGWVGCGRRVRVARVVQRQENKAGREVNTRYLINTPTPSTEVATLPWLAATVRRAGGLRGACAQKAGMKSVQGRPRHVQDRRHWRKKENQRFKYVLDVQG